MRSHLLIVSLSVFVTSVIFRKWSPVPMHSRIHLTLSSMRFSVSGFRLRSLIHMNLSIVHGNRYGSMCILLHIDIQLSAPYLEDAFFPLHNLSFFVKTQVFIGLWINIRVFDSIPLVHLSVFMPIPSSFHYCSSTVELEVKDSDASVSSFIIEDCFWLS